jgi:hypothetical protein
MSEEVIMSPEEAVQLPEEGCGSNCCFGVLDKCDRSTKSVVNLL